MAQNYFFMIKKIILLVIIFFSTLIYSQKSVKTSSYPTFNISNKKYIKTILKVYEKELSLSKEQKKILSKILLKYNKQFQKEYSNTKNKSKLNKIFKLHDIEIYQLLNEEQFHKFKEVRSSIEPYKKYRI